MSSTYENAVTEAATILDCFRLAKVEPPSNPRKLTRCPLPGHAERTASFHILPSLQGFKCFGCDAHGGMVAFLVAMNVASSNQEALFMLGDLHRIPREDGPGASFTQHRKRPAPPPFVPLPPETRRAYNPQDRQKLREALAGRCRLLTPQGATGADYLRMRGIAPDAADANDARFHPTWFGKSAVVFAVRDERGSLVAAQGRFLDPNASPKSISMGLIGSGVFATLDALDAQLVAVTEAPLDALSLAACGLPAIALLGCGLKPWLRRMLKFRRVILATDDDEAGNKTADTLRRELTFSTVERFPFPPKCDGVTKDINDLLQRDPDALRQRVRTLLIDDAADVERNAADDLLRYAVEKLQAVADRRQAEAA